MVCRVTDMCSKEVICIKDGTRLGFVCDVDIDILSGKAEAIIIFGKPKFFGLSVVRTIFTSAGTTSPLSETIPFWWILILPTEEKIKSLFSQDFWTNSDKQQ